MRKLLLSLAIALISLTNCSKDKNDEEINNPPTEETIINPKNIFSGGIPKSVNGMQISLDSKGRVDKIMQGGDIYYFSYDGTAKTKSANEYPNDVIMYHPSKNAFDDYTIYMQLNKTYGFVENAIQIYSDGDRDTWKFEYNSDMQITKLIRSEGENEMTTMTYSNGNITRIAVKSEDKLSTPSNYQINYTTTAKKDGIKNIGCIMLFDELLGVDLDEMIYAYYAGILGKPTQQLPLQITNLSNSETYTYSWALSQSGYPISVSDDKKWLAKPIDFVW